MRRAASLAVIVVLLLAGSAAAQGRRPEPRRELDDLDPDKTKDKLDPALRRKLEDMVNERVKDQVDALVKKRLAEEMAATTRSLADAERAAVEDAVTARTKLELNARTLDLPIVESPSLVGIGFTPMLADLAQSPRQLSVSAPFGIDRDGNVQLGIAFDAAPVQMMLRHWLNPKDDAKSYRSKYWYRLISRTQMSIGATRGVSDFDEATRLSLGFRVVLFDFGDPRLDPIFEGDIEDATRAPLGALERVDEDAPLEDQRSYLTSTRVALSRLRTEVSRKLGEAEDRARQRNALRTRLALGWAPGWISREGEVNKLKSNGGAFWLTFAYGFDAPRALSTPWLKKYLQLILHTRYRHNEDAPGPDVAGRFFERNGYSFAGRLRTGYRSVFFSLETQIVTNRPRRQRFRQDTYYVFSSSLEYRLFQDAWLQASLGAEGRRDQLENETFFLFTFRWGVL